MKLYPQIDCTLNVQSFGTTFLMVLKGSEENINLLFNAFYNYGATAAGTEEKPIMPDFQNGTRTLATFWSSPKQMLTFFQNLFYHRHQAETEIAFEETLCSRIKGFQGGYKKHPEYIEFTEKLKEERTAFAKQQLALLQELSTTTMLRYNKNDEEFGEACDVHSIGRTNAERPDDNHRERSISSGFKSSIKDIEE